MQFDTDIASPHKDLFVAVRNTIMSFDDIQETKKEKITTYSCKGSGLCHIRTTAYGVDIGFLKGVFMNDPFSLLHGETKRMRVLSLENMSIKELNFYILEAIRINS